MSRRVRFRFSSGIEAVGVIEDEKVIEELLKNSPFESTANRWGDEIYFELPFDLGLKGERVVMRVGEIAYWPEGNSLCIFFGPTPVSRHGEPRAISKVKPLGEIVEGLDDLKMVKQGEKLRVEVEG